MTRGLVHCVRGATVPTPHTVLYRLRDTALHAHAHAHAHAHVTCACACACVPALHDLGVRDLQSVPSPLVTTRHRRAARVGALRLRLRLREGLGSRGRQPRRAALTRAHRSCFARHLWQSSKVIATTSSGSQVLGAPFAVSCRRSTVHAWKSSLS